MKIRFVHTLPLAPDTVLSTLRDQMSQVAAHLPNIKSVEEVEREQVAPHTIRVVNRWTADATIPMVARSLVTPEMLVWKDHALWNTESMECQWSIEPSYYPERFDCSGRNIYRSSEGSTELTVLGDVSINVDGVRRVPAFVAVQIKKAAERVIVSRVGPNYEQMCHGLLTFLRSCSETERS